MPATQPKILVYTPRGADQYADYVKRAGFTSVQAAASTEEARIHLPGTEIILCWKFPTFLLASPEASSVQWIQSLGAGVDDLVYDENIPSGVTLTRIVDQFGGPIAEYVFAYMLLLAKDILFLRDAQAQRNWSPFTPPFLSEKTIGVAGLGSIGGEIVRKARAFDMKIHGLSASGKNAHEVDQHFSPDQWHEFVKELDYLVLTLPLTNETRHRVNRDLLMNMKSQAVLMNVGRGALIAENDLVGALQAGHLGAAVLDVFEHEPLAENHPLWSMKNVFITPHISGPSTPHGVGDFFISNLQRYLTAQPLRGVVQRQLGY